MNANEQKRRNATHESLNWPYGHGQEIDQMNDYRSWRPRYRAMCPEPGLEDLFLVILIDGRRVAIHHAADHAKWRVAAERLAESQQCQVKVLPMGGRELMNFLGFAPSPPQSVENMDATFRTQAVRNCLDVLRDCSSQDEREQALSLLNHLGVLQATESPNETAAG